MRTHHAGSPNHCVVCEGIDDVQKELVAFETCDHGSRKCPSRKNCAKYKKSSFALHGVKLNINITFY